MTAISLLPENYPQYYENKYPVKVAGLQFTVFRGGPDHQIMGAELDIILPVKIEHVKTEHVTNEHVTNHHVKTEPWN